MTLPSQTRSCQDLSQRRAFTLVELMIVIVIIGILAGLAIPAIMRAVKTAKEGAYKQEIDSLADAVEKYRNKYGDYPPDGSSWQIMERHLRKAFPQILASELNLLNPTITTAAHLNSQGWTGDFWTRNTMAGIVAGVRNDFDQRVTGANGFVASDFKVMDPAEALVFFLGGFSSNPQRPFTGEGGPFVVTTGTAGAAPPAGVLTTGQTLQYNPQRSNASYEFRSDRLTVIQVGTSYVSNDEEFFLGTADANDLLPVYLNQADIENSSPIVYFDSRTYVVPKTTTYFNFYQRFSTNPTATVANDRHGSVRPLVSSARRAPAPAFVASATMPTDQVNHVRQHLFMEDKKFQVIGSGLDGVYGGMLSQEITGLASFQKRVESYIELPSGQSYYADPAGPATSWTPIYSRLIRAKATSDNDKYTMSTGQLDNSANCTDRTFFTSLAVPGK